MPTLAMYQVLTDDATMPLPNLSQGDEETQNRQRVIWNPTNDIKLNGAGENRPVLCYNVDLNSTNDFKLRVWIRDPQGATRTISEFSYDGNTTRQHMDPFRSEWVGTGNNKIFFDRLSGTGNVVIRNVIVLYQRVVN